MELCYQPQIRLSVGMRISIHVYLTDKRSKARVVYVDPDITLRCGIELDRAVKHLERTFDTR